MEYKNQHWITEAYLKAWRDHLTPNGAFVWVVTKNDHKVFSKAQRTLFSESDFYTTYDESGKRNLELERELKKIEDKFILLRDRKLQQHKPLSGEDRKTLALFISSIYARTKRQKEEGKEIWKDYIEMVDGLPIYLSSAIKQMPEYRDVVNLHSKQPMLFHLFSFINTTAPHLYQMRCVIYETNTMPGIITSDNPCLWFDPSVYNPHHPKTYFGIGSPSLNIILPVSPKQFLILKNTRGDGYVDLQKNPEDEEEFVDLINCFTASNCEEYIVVNQKTYKEKWFEE